jgi:hypothetical protein
MMRHVTKLLARYSLALLPALLLPACHDGHLNVLGYTTKPNYDTSIKTVRVNIFENHTAYRNLEIELQQALVREIQKETNYKIVGLDCSADSEISGLIRGYDKNIFNRTQQNETREAETVLTVELVWKDLRSGEILSSPARGVTNPPVVPPIMPGVGMASAMPLPPSTPVAPADTLPPPTPVPPCPPAPPPPVVIQSRASILPELGISNAAARQKNVDSLAVQIVSMMEEPWTLHPNCNCK